MVVNILLLIAFWAIGAILYSFGIMQIILCLTTAIPLTKSYIQKSKHLVDSKGIYRRIATTIIFWSVISVIAIVLIIYYGNTYMKIGFAIGIVICFFISIANWGKNKSNKFDYLKTYGRCFAPNDLAKFQCKLAYPNASDYGIDAYLGLYKFIHNIEDNKLFWANTAGAGNLDIFLLPIASALMDIKNIEENIKNEVLDMINEDIHASHSSYGEDMIKSTIGITINDVYQVLNQNSLLYVDSEDFADLFALDLCTVFKVQASNSSMLVADVKIILRDLTN